jgi:hypothetical protein
LFKGVKHGKNLKVFSKWNVHKTKQDAEKDVADENFAKQVE